MAILSNEIKQFAAGNTDFFVAFQDYYIHANKVNHQSDLGGYDASLSLDEKKAKVDSAFFAKVESMSGMKRTAENANAWAANPSVQWVK